MENTLYQLPNVRPLYGNCILNVRYSEGSAVDTAVVSIDEKDIGSFCTTITSSNIDPWNDFYGIGPV